MSDASVVGAATQQRPNARRIIPFKAWCELNAISERHGRHLISIGEGPTLTELGKRRFGVREDHNRQWQNGRIRGAK